MSRRAVTSLIGAVLVVFLGSPAAFADHHKGGKGDKHHGRTTTAPRTFTARPTGTSGHKAVDRRDVIVIDRDGHRRVVADYFSREGLPPGLAKRQSLPPGLERQLRERGRLPPGLEKRLIPIPGPLAGRLPAQPPYYSRYFIGRDLVILDRRTDRIAAIIPNVVPLNR